MKMFRFVLLWSVLLLGTGSIIAQTAEPPFYKDIQAFKAKDSLNPPPKGAILFIGSSSFTKWTNVQEMFPGYTILNRGFGGSNLLDLIRYAPDIIYPYQPKQVVIYCGENDIAGGNVDSKEVAERFKTLFGMIRRQFPGLPVIFVSMKPSPSREKFFPVIKQANQIIKNFLWQQGNAMYVDVYNKMLDANGKPQTNLFLEDMLHMKPEGYVIWHDALWPHLLKN